MRLTKEQKTVSHFFYILFALIFAVFGSGDWGFKALISGIMIFLSMWLFFIIIGKVEPYKNLLMMSPFLGFLISLSVFFMDQSYDFEKAITVGFALFVTIWILTFLVFVIVTIYKATSNNRHFRTAL